MKCHGIWIHEENKYRIKLKLEPQNHVEPHKLEQKAVHCSSNREDHQDLIVKRQNKKERERNSGQ